MADQADTIRDLKRRRAAMDTEFRYWEPHFKELRDHIIPTRGRFHLREDRRGSSINKMIIDSAGQKALRTLRAGLMSGMTSPSRPWFRLGLYDDELADRPAVKQYLEVAQKRMYTVMRGSNIYRTLDACYSDVGLFGTFCGLLVSDFDTLIHSHAFPMGSYRIAEDENGVVTSVQYDCKRTVAQLVQQFGIENCSSSTQNLYKRNHLHEWVDITHAIDPRLERDPMSPFNTDMPWASHYWERTETSKLLQEGGFAFNPILAPRWESVMGETYSVSSPGMMALGDCRQLQLQQREKAMAIQMMTRPPMIAPAGFARKFKNIPGGITTVDSQDLQKGGLRPAYQASPDVNALMFDINETRRRISEAFFEDLFMLTVQSDRRQITAREVAERHEEKLIVLGPVLEALDHGLLQPIIEATFNYMQQSQLLPPAPEELENAALKVEYVSLLAQAQKMVGTASIERTVGFVGSLAQIKPEALDLIDSDVMVREFADQVGPPVKSVRDADQVAAIREQRAQQEQQAQAMSMLESGAGTAKLLSEANERGARALEQQRGMG